MPSKQMGFRLSGQTRRRFSDGASVGFWERGTYQGLLWLLAFWTCISHLEEMQEEGM
jgi:hypothetical protein